MHRLYQENWQIAELLQPFLCVLHSEAKPIKYVLYVCPTIHTLHALYMYNIYHTVHALKPLGNNTATHRLEYLWPNENKHLPFWMKIKFVPLSFFRWWHIPLESLRSTWRNMALEWELASIYSYSAHQSHSWSGTLSPSPQLPRRITSVSTYGSLGIGLQPSSRPLEQRKKLWRNCGCYQGLNKTLYIFKCYFYILK